VRVNGLRTIICVVSIPPWTCGRVDVWTCGPVDLSIPHRAVPCRADRPRTRAVSMYLARSMADHIARPEMRINNCQGYTYKSWLLLAPISCATLISISRTMDYRHHATDVIAGAVVGILGAWYSYRQYYPVSGLARSGSLVRGFAGSRVRGFAGSRVRGFAGSDAVGLTHLLSIYNCCCHRGRLVYFSIPSHPRPHSRPRPRVRPGP
jgi:hypothetical protein